VSYGGDAYSQKSGQTPSSRPDTVKVIVKK